jgi:predicted Zn-dependent protease
LRAIDIEPTYVEAFRGLIEVYRAAGRSTECAQMLTRLLQIEPNSAADRVALAALLMERREWMRALAQYTAAVRIDPRNADALYGFARAAEESGMADRAADAAALGRTRFPDDKRFARLVETLRRPREEGSK